MDNSPRTGAAIMFPGMGPTLFDDVSRFMVTNQHARRLIAEADDVLGYPLVRRYRETPGHYSEEAQVSFLVNCLALAEWSTQERGIEPDVCTGPSFGGKAAAVYAGALSFADAVRMTAGFARLMEDYFSTEHRDVVTHSFARTPAAILDEVLAELAEQGEWYDISCYIDDDFYMVSLREGRLEWLEARLRRVGGLPLYTLRPPMHSRAFGGLRRRAEDEIVSAISFADPRLPLVADLDGSVRTTGSQVRELLLDGFVQAVRWPEVVATLLRLRVGTLHVAGADSLFSRVPCTIRAFDVVGATPKTAMQPRRRLPA